MQPHFKEKLLPTQIDLARSDLGLERDTHDFLTDNVSVIIHAAANTKLNPPLRYGLDASAVEYRLT